MQRDRLKYNASIRDVSVKGCRVESVIKPFTGMQLEVSLQLPGEATRSLSRRRPLTGSWHGIEFSPLHLRNRAPQSIDYQLSSATHAA
jgi:hypothetical protein